MARLSVAVSCVLLLAVGCSRTGRLVEPPAGDLRGTWEEAYTLEVLGIGILEDPDSPIHEISLVSRIAFVGQTFQITTYRIEGSNEIPGADFFGVYSLSGDTLSFLLDTLVSSLQSRAYRFHYAVENDNLTISELPTDMGNCLYAISLRSLPWQHADASYIVMGTRRSGTFRRITE